ncbi:MAG: 50S ribosomal protein L28 [Actinobacteria bacterium]|nr:MAG: 50S ribosomal protein L28 [Actinomycetota bacterium]
MANICEVCGKKPQFGKKVSHSHRKTPRRFSANIQKVRVKEDGKIIHKRVCTSCIKAGKITKA